MEMHEQIASGKAGKAWFIMKHRLPGQVGRHSISSE
jgi:hypothetical protein